MGNDLEKMPSSGPETPNVIDAEFEVKSGPTKTEADPVRISQKEQAKLDRAFSDAEAKQTRQDDKELGRVAASLQEIYGSQGNTAEKSPKGGELLIKAGMMLDEAKIKLEKGKLVPNIDQIRLFEKTLERYQQTEEYSRSSSMDRGVTGSLLAEAREIISLHEELETKESKGDQSSGERDQWIAELMMRIEEQKGVVEKHRGELDKTRKELETIENRSFWRSLWTGDPLGLIDSPKKQEELERRKRHLQGLNKDLVSLEDKLEKAVKNDPIKGWR